ncbi:MAG TPA: chemotaxis-specific protein-glutamate methyltransferase CheB [Polyangiaceae bacterium]
MSRPRTRVLVVDDSAFARKVVRQILSSDRDLEVIGTARDGLDALEKIGELKPDVVTLDLRMPNLDGLGVLRALQGRPGPRCIVVSTSDDQSDLAIRALQAGAVDLVHKPTALATDQLYELSTELVEKVKVASRARQPEPEATVRTPKDGLRSPSSPGSGIALVVLGASTGGPQAVTRLLGELPADFPVPLAIVVHIPVGYTTALSERLDASSAVDVVEAYDGAFLRPGLVVVARAGMHLKLVGAPGDARVRLDVAPLDTAHRPAVDVLFRSAAETHGPRVLGVVLTGMGADGLEGARAIRERGGRIVTEAESSCVVYGMPRAVDEAGLSDHSVPLGKVTETIRRLTLAR